MARLRWMTSLGALLSIVMTSAPPAAATSSPVATFEVFERDENGWRELWVPWVTQTGEITNCGPTAAAMLLAAYRGVSQEVELVAIRDQLGEWSWQQFALRRFAIPGYDAGMSTPQILRTTLNNFSDGPRFEIIEPHPWLPTEAYALASLHARLDEGRPVLALVQASSLWGNDSVALHWVVVRGVDRQHIIFNDSADTGRMMLPVDQFWEAWRLKPVYRKLPMIGPFTAVVADRPLPWHATWMDLATH